MNKCYIGPYQGKTDLTYSGVSLMHTSHFTSRAYLGLFCSCHLPEFHWPSWLDDDGLNVNFTNLHLSMPLTESQKTNFIAKLAHAQTIMHNLYSSCNYSRIHNNQYCTLIKWPPIWYNVLFNRCVELSTGLQDYCELWLMIYEDAKWLPMAHHNR